MEHNRVRHVGENRTVSLFSLERKFNVVFNNRRARKLFFRELFQRNVAESAETGI